jgi:biopolymer transport protein ExbD
MKSRMLNTFRSDSFLIIAALLIAAVLFTAGVGKTQQLQQGISVQMPTTGSASSLPEADNADAWIVTVNANNDIYFGVDPMTPQSLFDAMKMRPRIRGQELYVKADGRASSATVAQVLSVAHTDMFERVILLTQQSSGAQAGSVVAPKGLPLWIDSATVSEAVVVQIEPGQDRDGSPFLKVDNQEVSLKGLQRKLEERLQDRRDRVVVIKPGQVPFADMAHVVDVCNMSAAKTVLAASTL